MDRATRIFAVYLVIVFVVAMTAQGFAASPHSNDKGNKHGNSGGEQTTTEQAAAQVSAPEAPVLEAPVPAPAPDASAPEGDSAPAPLPAPAPAPEAAAVVAAAEPIVAAAAITPAASVAPVFILGNPALGDGGVKIDPPRSGTYHYGDVNEVNEPGVPDDFEIVITVASDSKTFSFTCNYLITQVIVKGGPDAYAYNYPGGTYGDSGLVSPTMSNGQVPGLSHVNFYFAPETPKVRIAATKFHDDGAGADFANGTRSGDEEEWLDGFRFDLYSGPDSDGPWTFVESATSTLPDGQADFGQHAVGWYKVVEVLSAEQIAAGWYCTTGGGERIFEATTLGVACETAVAAVSFGNVQEPEEETSDLKVYKFLDENENGEFDEGEEMLGDWDFTLTRESAPIGPVGLNVSAIELVGIGSTDEDGELLFSDLALGEYAVTETLQDGWHSTTGLKQFATVVAGDTAEVWFGNHPDEDEPETGDLIIYKYLDENENSEFDEGEEMLEDWEFTVTIETPPLVGGTSAAAVAYVGDGLTDPDGELLFSNLEPNEYTVRETLQDGWHNTTPLTQEIDVVAGATAELWFGNHPDPDEPELGTLVVHKYEDANENKVFDVGEKMLGDWEFTVINPAGPVVPSGLGASVALIGSGKTGSDGTLTFSELNPGDVVVTETLQDGWKSTTGLSQEAQIVAGQTTHVWFGNAEDFLRFTELDLAITKVADDHTVDEGQLVTYTLTYWNLMSEEDAYNYTIVDDYDERYLTIVDAGGGAVTGGKITWNKPGPLTQAMGKQTITYTARVIADMPDKVTNIDNVVVIDDDRDFNYTNNRDDERVVYKPKTPDDPFLPFTGGEYLMVLIAAMTAACIGLVFRLQPRGSK